MSRRPDIHAPAVCAPLEETNKVLLELERILGSALFRTSRRCQILLRRIVELSLAGDLESLKERALGIDVFDRPADYDTSQDPVVRTTAAEIRKKLAQYYMEAGRDSDGRIELTAGSYHAQFHFSAVRPQTPVRPARSRRRLGIAVAIIIAILAGVTATFTAVKSSRSPLEDLWGPTLESPGAVLVCIGLQAAYNLRSAPAQDAIQGIGRDPSMPGPIREKDLILLKDRYVDLYEAVCLVRVTALLEKYGKAYRVRTQHSTTFADMRDTPAVLIGAFDNPWTLRAAGQLRFTFSKDSARDVGMVRDSLHPEKSEWALKNYWPEWDIQNDYAIITRTVDATTDRPVIIAAGLTQYGTIGAGEFLTNPEYFSEAVNKLPADWRRRSLQIVLSVPVVNRIPGRPRILAVHVW
jgi:hypothetical protein